MCEFIAISPYYFKRHLSGRHFRAKILSENKSDLKCDKCGMNFIKSYLLSNHIGSYHDRSYELYQEYLDSSGLVEEDDNTEHAVTAKDDVVKAGCLEKK